MSKTPVLFANHTGELAGAERSLLDLIEALGEQVAATVACPPGELLESLRDRGVATADLPAITLSFRPHPVRTARGLGEILQAGRALRRIAGESGAALIHANTERAGLAGLVATRRGGPPLVVHARTRFPENALGAATAAALGRGAAAVIANSAYTARQFRTGQVEVVHNPIDGARFDPARCDREAAREALGLGPQDLVLAVVGYLAPVKSQDDAIRVLAAIKPRFPAARLVLAGATRFSGPAAREDTSAYADTLRELAGELGLAADVHFVGERDDVREVLAASDVLLAPSQREGFGRVVLEGMAMGLAVIATEVGGPAEIIRSAAAEGILLAPNDPLAWAHVTAQLLDDPARRRSLGENARARALRDFSPQVHATGVLSVYRRALGEMPRA